MKTIDLTAAEARHHFPSLFDAEFRRRKGLPHSEADAISYREDLFVIHGGNDFTDLPFPAKVEFRNGRVAIFNSSALPEEIKADGLDLFKPSSCETYLWDAGCIKRLICGSLTITDARAFPHEIDAFDLTLNISEEGEMEMRKENVFDLRHRKICLACPTLPEHVGLLTFLGSLSVENIIGLECQINGMELHHWACQPKIVEERESFMEKRQQELMDMALANYKVVYKARNDLRDDANSSQQGMESELQLI